MSRTLIIFGDRTAAEVAETAQMADAQSFATIETLFFEAESFDESAAALESDARSISFLAAVTDISLKRSIVGAAKSRGWTAHSVIHPSAVVSSTAHVGLGSFVGPLAVVSTDVRIGEHSIIHIHASIGHDSQIGSLAAILPGARLSGNVVLGERCLVGSNAFIAAGVHVGHDCHVDALTYVGHDLNDGYLASVRTQSPVRRVNIPKVDH